MEAAWSLLRSWGRLVGRVTGTKTCFEHLYILHPAFPAGPFDAYVATAPVIKVHDWTP